MRPKTTKVLYWVFTILFAGAMLYSGIAELMQTEQGKEVMQHLGYPLYLNIILGIAKVLGAVALLQTGFKTIKEWAYAGFTIDIVGASLSMFFVGDSMLVALSPVIFLAVMFISYALWKKQYPD